MYRFKYDQRPTLEIAQEQGKKPQIVLFGFVAAVGLVGLGLAGGMAVLGDRGGETAPASTAQQIAALIAPEQAADTTRSNMVQTERRGIRYQPGRAEQVVVQPIVVPTTPRTAGTFDVQIAQLPQNDISEPDLAQLVTRSIGNVASAPLGLSPDALGTNVADVAVSLTSQQAPPVQVAPAPAAEPVAAAAPVSTQIDPNTLFSASAAQARDGCVADLQTLARDSRVYFPSGGLNPDEQGIVQARLISFVARECPGVTIQVEGHSDASGNSASNMRLSEARAQTVITRLAASGVDTSMFVAIGYGDERPSGLVGPQPASFYDRRVEFSVISNGVAALPPITQASFSGQVPACVIQLEQAVSNIQLFFAPRSITAPQSDLGEVYQLAAAADACPQARLRVIGQFSDAQGSGETPTTGRMRAISLISALGASGYDADRMVVAAYSESNPVAGVSDRRIDFDVIRELQ